MSASDDTPVRHEEDDLPLVANVELRPARLAAEITERLAPLEQASFFCSLVDSALDAIVAHRPDGTIVWANQGAAELLGYTDDEMLALPPYGWLAPRQLVSAPRRIEKLLRAGQLTFDSGVRCKDGTLIDTEVSTRRVDTALGPIVVAVIRDVSEWIESKRALEHLAYHDPLTGLANRISFDERVELAIADARRFDDILGLAYIDLDEFKPVNDRFGHAVGDEVLIEVGRRLREEVRVQDTVARIGGDEFVIILPRLATPDALEHVAKRLVERIEEPVQALGYIINIMASVGLARFDAEADDARTLLVKADVAMYAAKKDPAHPWMLYGHDMPIPDGRLDR